MAKKKEVKKKSTKKSATMSGSAKKVKKETGSVKKQTNTISKKTELISKPIDEKTQKNTIIILIAALILIGLGYYLTTIDWGSEPEPTTDIYELTKVDIVSLPGFTDDLIKGEQISIYGIRLGDSREKVEKNEMLGEPDIVTEFNDTKNVINYEYKQKFDLNNSGIVLNIVDDKVKRITIKSSFDDYLIGNTKMNKTLRDIYDDFGIPDSQEQMPYFRIFNYPNRDMQVFVQKNKLNGISLYVLE